jgi:hypothetical protein
MYGHDKILLDVRKLLLEKVGFVVDAACTQQEFIRKARQGKPPYSLLVICHSTPQQEHGPIQAIAGEVNSPVYHVPTLVTPQSLIRGIFGLVA